MSTRGDAYARVVTANPVPTVLDVPDDVQKRLTTATALS